MATARTEGAQVILPCDLVCWPLVKEMLSELQGRLINENVSEQETAWYMHAIHNTIQKEESRPVDSKEPSWIGTQAREKRSLQADVQRFRSQLLSYCRRKPGPNCVWYGMVQYLKGLTKAGADGFLYNLLPRVIEMALGIEDCLREEGLSLSLQQYGGETKLSRQFVCSVVACCFLCLFPERAKHETSSLNTVNFTTFFKQLPLPAQVTKLECILCYFESVIKRGMEIPGSILFIRKSAAREHLLTFEELSRCELRLCPVSVHHTGVIEDSCPQAVHVDFVNKFGEGSLLGTEKVQNEIRFCVCPELLVSLLFVENLEPNEAVFVSGFEQFSHTTGSADSVCFAGPHSGSGKLQSLVIVDAYRDKPLASQYSESSLLGDLNKAVIGFSSQIKSKARLSPLVRKTKERDGAHDVAADMVTCVMTEAVSRAGEESRVGGQYEHGPGRQHALHHHHQQGDLDRAESDGHRVDINAQLQLEVSTAEDQKSPASFVCTKSISSTARPDQPFQASVKPPVLPATISPFPGHLISEHPPTDASHLGPSAQNVINLDSVCPLSASSLVSSQHPDPHSVPPSHISPPLLAADQPSASSSLEPPHPPPPLPTLSSPSLTGPSEHLGQIMFESDSLGNLRRVLVDRSSYMSPSLPQADSRSAVSSLSLFSSHETEGARVSVSGDLKSLLRLSKDSESTEAKSDLSLFSSQEHPVESVLSTLTNTSSSSRKSSIPFPTAERPETNVSLSILSSSDCHVETDNLHQSSSIPLLTSSDYNDIALDTALSLRSQEEPKISPSYARSPSLADSSEYLFQQRSPTLSQQGDNSDDASSLGNTPRSLDITIPTVVPSLSGPSLERAGSGLSNLSMTVNVDSPTPSCTSIEDEFGKLLYVNVDNEGETAESGKLGAYVSPRQHKRIQSLLSPRSRLAYQRQQMSASNQPPAVPLHSPHQSQPSLPTSTSSPGAAPAVEIPSVSYPAEATNIAVEPDQGTIHSTATSTSTATAPTTTISISTSSSSSPSDSNRAPLLRQNSRDLYVELKEFLSSSHCSSRDSTGSWSGIHPPLASTSSTSSFSSCSGSLSSHRGSNGYTGDFLEFWNQYRRRSSQLSDASSYAASSSTSGASRRSSSSHKHSTDFSTDLEDICESFLKPSHGVIEEEGGGPVGIVSDFATQLVSTALRSGILAAVSTSVAAEADASKAVQKDSTSEKGLVISSNVTDSGSKESAQKGDIATLESKSIGSTSMSQENPLSTRMKSAIPQPHGSGRTQRLPSSGNTQYEPSLKRREGDQTAVGPEGKVKSRHESMESLPKSRLESMESLPSPGASRSMSTHSALPRRGLMGKAYPRAGTLVRQQSVTVHPEDEESEASGKPKTSSETEMHPPLDVRIKRSQQSSKQAEETGAILGGKDTQGDIQSATLSGPYPIMSQSESPALPHRLLSISTPLSYPSSDSGYLSLMSASGRADSDTSFLHSPASSCGPPSSRLDSLHSDASIAPVARTVGERKKRQPSAQEAQHSEKTVSIKPKQKQEMFATLESKTIYLNAPPPRALHADTASPGKRPMPPQKPISQIQKLSLREAVPTLKSKMTPDRQSPSGGPKGKLTSSAIPRIRTTSDPGGSRSPTKDSSKLKKSESYLKKPDSKQGREKSKRTVRAISEPTDILGTKSNVGKEIHSSDSQSQPKKSERKVSRGETKLKRLDVKPEKVSKESTQRVKSSKVASIPTKSSQATKYSSTRRLSNTSGEGADGSLSSSPVSAQPSSGASGPSKSPGIPKYRESSRRTELPTSIQAKTPGSPIKSSKAEMATAVGKTRTDKEKKRYQGSIPGRHKSAATERQPRLEPIFRPHKSRYVFSDVAAPLSDGKRSRKPREESSKSKQDSRRHHQSDLKKSQRHQIERRKFIKAELELKRKLQPKLSPQVHKFVNSLADRTISEAVLEGADIVAQQSLISLLPSGHVGEISDEVYSWFSNKIINQVFSHILHDLESRDCHFQTPPEQPQIDEGEISLRQLREIGASSASPGEELTSQSLLSPMDASATDSMARSLSPPSMSCLTRRVTSPSSPKSPAALGGAGGENIVNTSHKRQGSLKMVKFQMGSGRRGSDADAAETVPGPPPPSHPHTAASPVSPSSTSSLHVPSSSTVGLFPIKPSSNIPIPGTRRRSSFDVASLSPPPSIRAMGFSPPLRPTPLLATSLFAPLSSETLGSSAAVPAPTGNLTKDLHSVDLSLDIYQVAANIVDQVFQNISDNALASHCTVSPCDDEESHYDRRHYEGFVTNIFSSSTAASPSSGGAVKTGSSSAQRGGNHQQTRRSVSPSLGSLFSRQPMSRQVLTSAFLRVEGGGGWGPSLRTYQRRSSEPGQTSLQLSLQALNSIKFSTQAADEQARQRKVSRTDDDIGRSSSGRAWRRGSLDGGFASSSSSSFEGRRRSSCGFKDPMLSRFAEELMKADTSVPELVIVGSHPSSTSTGSRRSSLSGFRGTTLAYLESELLNTSFTSINSVPMSSSTSPRASQRRHRRRQRRTTATTTTTATASTCDSNYLWRGDLDRSHSRESAHSQASGFAGGGGGGSQWKSDSSDTEYWFPPPRLVGEEFRLEYERQHSQEDLQDYASFFAGQVVQEAVCVLKQDPDFQEFSLKDPEAGDIDIFAENLSDQIMRDVLLSQRQLGDDSISEHFRSQAHERVGSRDSQVFGTLSSLSAELGREAEQRVKKSSSPGASYFGEGARPKVLTPSQRKEYSKRVRTSTPPKDIPSPRKSPKGLHSGRKDVKSGQSRQRDSLSKSHIPSTHRKFLQVIPSPTKSSSASSVCTKASTSPTSPQPESSQPSHLAKHSTDSSQTEMKNVCGLRSTLLSQMKDAEPAKQRRAISGEFYSGSSSDTSSYDSDDTSSSLLSSSSSKEEVVDIGPQGLLLTDESERARRLSKRRQQNQATRNREAITSWLAETKRESPHYRDHEQDIISAGEGKPKAEFGGEADYNKGRESHGFVNPAHFSQITMSTREEDTTFERSLQASVHSRDENDGHGVVSVTEASPAEISPELEAFAENLSQSVLFEAVGDFSHQSWHRFVSYNQPIVSGNWGCGDAQLKFVLQWLAASLSRCPNLVYYTLHERSLSEVSNVVEVFSGRTVRELAEILRSYCHHTRSLGLVTSTSMSTSLSTHSSSAGTIAKAPSGTASSFLLSFTSSSSSAAARARETESRNATVESGEHWKEQQQTEPRQGENKQIQPLGPSLELESAVPHQDEQGQISLFDFILQKAQPR